MAKAAQAKKIETAFEPVVEFNKMMVETVEAVFNMQMESLQTYTKLGLDNLNASLHVRNVDDMVAFAEKQKELAQEASDRFTSDAKAMADINTRLVDETRTLAVNNLKTAMAAAKAA